MEDELVISCNFPFKKCVKCKELEIETSPMYADGALVLLVITCSNKNICQNAFEIWKGDKSEQTNTVN